VRKSLAAADPDSYLASLTGWQRSTVGTLLSLIRKTVDVDEEIKWGHLVFFFNGPVLLIRAEDKRVLFGFWRGQRLRNIEARLKPGGKYEMATVELREGDTIAPAVVRRLVKQAVALNRKLGDPRLAANEKRREPQARRRK